MLFNRVLIGAAFVLGGTALGVALAGPSDSTAHAVTPASVSVPTNSTPMFCTASACYHVNPDGTLGQQAP